MTSKDIHALEPVDLSDERLLAVASFCREQARNGDLFAAATAAECEREMSRRFGGTTTMAAELSETPAVRTWKRWQH